MGKKKKIITVVFAFAMLFWANAETYYFTGDEKTEKTFTADGAWTNALGEAIKVTSAATTYQNDDFVVGSGQIMTTTSSRDNTAREFYCKSLLLEGSENGKAQFIFRGSAFSRVNFVLGPYSEIYLNGRNPVTKPCGIQSATIFVRGDAIGDATARISASTVMTHEDGARIVGPILGTGSLLFTYRGEAPTQIKPITLMTRDDRDIGVAANENFTGTMKIKGLKANMPLPLHLKTYTLSALGGDPATFQQKGLELEYAKIVAYSNCTVTANRGVYVSNNSTIEVGEGYTFTISGETAFATPSTKLSKTGEGTLTLGGEVAAGTFDVSAGTLNIAEEATLAFHFANNSPSPVLKISGAGTVNIPSLVKVKVTMDEDVRLSSKQTYVLTSTFDFTGKTVRLVNSSEWVKSVEVDESGNLVMNVKPRGLVILMQ